MIGRLLRLGVRVVLALAIAGPLTMLPKSPLSEPDRSEVATGSSAPSGLDTTATPTDAIGKTATVVTKPSTTREPTTTPTTAPATPPSLLFGLGPTADSASASRLAAEAPVGMLTTWYTTPDDLPWIVAWRTNVVADAYAQGKALHLVVFSDDPEVTFETAHGTACGRPYPLSDHFLDDMAQLATTFGADRGAPPFYVTLFTELQTYACVDNAWDATPTSNTYFRALQARYLEAVELFHLLAPNARVSIGWGGWQARWDDRDTGGGRSMIPYFAEAMRESDFQSVQAMESDTNVTDLRAMARILGTYGPVMVAHFKPDDGSQSTFDADVQAIFTDGYLAELNQLGLFAFSFMDQVNVNASEDAFQAVASAVRRYGS